jgi:hypothetical protein
MKVSINPDAPTKDPATISTLLPIIKPVKAAAIPEKEFSKDTTTGISAPPIGKTIMIPKTLEINIMANNISWSRGSEILR